MITGFLEAADAAPEELSTIANVIDRAADALRSRGGTRQAGHHGVMAYVGPADQAKE